jgi:hypothetical protein
MLWGIFTTSGFLSARDCTGKMRQMVPINIKITSLCLLSFMILFIDNLLTSIIHLENFTTQLIARKIIILSDCQLIILNYAATAPDKLSRVLVYQFSMNFSFFKAGYLVRCPSHAFLSNVV